MEAKGKSSAQVQWNLAGFIAILTSAACEWCLIFLLFVDALLSYLLTKFADYCDLEKPCILCSRLEHVTGNEIPQLYEDLLCRNHISKLTSWIANQIYGKHDGIRMHEDFHFPFNTEDSCNREMHTFSVCNSGSDIENYGSRRPVLSRSCVQSPVQSPIHSPIHSPIYSPTRSPVDLGPWSCCSSPWRHKGKLKGVMLKSSGTKHAKPNIPLPRLPHRSRLNRNRDSSKKIRDKSPASVTSRRSGKGGVDPLSHVGYNELKFGSENDSEFLLSDDDYGSRLTRLNHEPKMKGSSRVSKNQPKATPNGSRPGRHGKRSSKPKRSLSEPWPVFSKASDVQFSGFDHNFENALGELNYQKSNPKSNPSALPELISLDDILPSPNVLEKNIAGTSDFGDASINKNFELLQSICAKDRSSVKNDLVMSDLALLKSNHTNVTAETESVGSVTERDYSGVTTEALFTPTSNVKAVYESEGSIKERDSSGIRTEALSTPSHSNTNTVPGSDHSNGNIKETDSSDTTKEVIIEPNHGNVNAVPERQRSIVQRDSSSTSAGCAEQPKVQEIARVDEEMKPLDSQGSSAQQNNVSHENTSLTVNSCDDEKQTTYGFSANSKPMIHTSASVESGLESLDGGYVTEIEGENIVDQLKRQIEFDRKCIKELYRELEEERNASAIAANQAMAMITKLQEEKAAFHMEALHYLRMMEEQAEFDVDALEKANDLLAEREKEIQDLEAELEFSKYDLQDESMMKNSHDNCFDVKDGIAPAESTVMSAAKHDLSVTSDSGTTEVPKGSNEPPFSETTLLEFEDEKLYITNCLKTLERKLSEISCKGVSSKTLNRGHSQKHMVDGRSQKGTPRKERTRFNGQLEVDDLHEQKDLHMSNGSTATQEGPTNCNSGDGLECEDNESDSRGEQDLDPSEMDLEILENEISDLNDRLEALETDHDFLEHMLYSLQNGAEGLKFVREIAQQLQELRKIGTGFR